MGLRSRGSDLLVAAGFIRPAVLLRGLAMRRPAVSRLPIAVVLGVTGLIAEPIAWLQWILFGRRLRRLRLPRDPVVVIGHWRSGTTFLHQLLACDPRAATARNRLTMAPQVALILKPLICCILPYVMTSIRPIDHVPWSADDPQEDEIGLARLTIETNMAGIAFPRLYRRCFRQFVLNQSAEFEQQLLDFSRLTWLEDGRGKRHLLIKNSAHSARIPLLLRLFPGVRFILLKREPKDSIRSLVQVKQELAALVGLQELPDELTQVEETFSSYVELMQAFEASRHLIPSGQLAELTYEELCESPLESLERIYKDLGLTSWEEAHHPLVQRVQQARSYQPRPVTLQRRSDELLQDLLSTC